MKRRVPLVNVHLPEGLDPVHAVAVAERHGEIVGTDQARVAADVGEIGARVQAGEVLEVDLDLEAVGWEDLVTADTLAFLADDSVSTRSRYPYSSSR